MEIVFVASEMVPLCKTGGLADVIGSLPAVLAERGYNISVFLPGYSAINKGKFGFGQTGLEIYVPVGSQIEKASIRKTVLKGVNIYLLENQEFFGRNGLYGDSGGDFPDNSRRFIFFCRGAVEAMIKMNMRPDIIHCHDWQSALVVPYIKTVYGDNPLFAGASCIFTIHNLGYQGIFPDSVFWLTGLPGEAYNWKKMEYWGNVSFLKGGVVYADAVTTVSEGYSREILTEDLGYGMQGVFRERERDIYGIINGIDYKEWDPATDPYIPENYSFGNLKGKSECKKKLIERTGLKISENMPLFGVVSRLDEQKGINLLIECYEKLAKMGIGIVILGTGSKSISDSIKSITDSHPGKISAVFDFNNELAHLIYAGSDGFLMPSRYEPCGLGQMIAMRYGTLPVVHSTGGLSDTVFEIEGSEKDNGFSFNKFNAESFYSAVSKAVGIYKSGSDNLWKKAMIRAMKTDFSWNASGIQYEKLYETISEKKKSNNM